MIGRLALREVGALVQTMGMVERLLGGQERSAGPINLRPLGLGDLGWIARRQAILYAQEYGWDASYEALAAEILAGFVRSHDPAAERSWIAERDGEVVGSVFVMRGSDTVAKLRLLYVEPAARGFGLGRTLVDACIDFARASGAVYLPGSGFPVRGGGSASFLRQGPGWGDVGPGAVVLRVGRARYCRTLWRRPACHG